MRRLIDRANSVQVKFVVDSPADFDEIETVIATLALPHQVVWLMPQGVTVADLQSAETWLRPWCEQHGYTYGDRMQIRWYGNRRGT
jgi:7-carboxy-7-deazaguanine synthase